MMPAKRYLSQKLIAFFLMAIMLFVLLWGTGRANNRNSGQAYIAFVKGEVTVTRSDVEMTGKKHFSLKNEDLISVKKDSIAIIKSKASIIKLSGLTYYKLDLTKPEILNGKLSKGTLVIQFLKSKLSIRNMRKLKDEEMTIKTDTAALGIRGTKLFVHDGDKTHTVVSVEHGNVQLKGKKQDQHIEMTEGHSSLINIHHQALHPRSFGHEDKINWNLNHEGEELAHHPELISHIEKVWELHKKHLAKKWNKKVNNETNKFEKQKEDMQKKFNSMGGESPFGEGGFPSN